MRVDGTCSLWHYNQSFVYEFNGTNFKPGFDYAIGYFWRMQGSLPVLVRGKTP